VPDADFITPVFGQVDYQASLDLRVNVLKPAAFDSPSHKIKVEWINENTARIGFADVSAAMDADFVLVCALHDEIAASGMVFPKEGNEKLLYLTFIPELEPLAAPEGKNYIFVIDISGSMMGEKLAQAKSALQLALRNLTEGDSFNLVAFNHAFTRFDKRFKPFNQQNLNLASQGTRQVLSVIVQLFWAKPGSIVMIEEPELSLHPEAQDKLPALFAAAIRDGKQVMITTHSHYLLLALTKAVKAGLPAKDIAIYEVKKEPETGTIAKLIEVTKEGYLREWVTSFAEVDTELLDRRLGRKRDRKAPAK